MRRFVVLDDYVDAALDARARDETARLLDAKPVARRPRAAHRRGRRGRPLRRLDDLARAARRARSISRAPTRSGCCARRCCVSVRSTFAAQALLDDLRPELVLFNERNYAAEAPLSDLALERGLNVIQFVAASQNDSQVFKRYTAETRRLHPRSLSDASWERVKAMPWSEAHDRELAAELARRYDGSQTLTWRNQEWTRERSPDEIRAELGLDPAKRTAVVFAHVLWDANMFFGEDLFDDQEQWFVETVRAACANDRVNWVVKLHPANVWKRKRDGVEGELGDLRAIREHVGELPDARARDAARQPDRDALAVRRHRRRRHDPRLGRLGASVLRRAGADRRDRLLLGSRLHGRLGDPRASTWAGSRGSRRCRRSARTRSSSRAGTRMRCCCSGRCAFTSFRTKVRPLEGLGHPLDHNLALRVRSRDEMLRAPRSAAARRVGRRQPRARLPRAARVRGRARCRRRLVELGLDVVRVEARQLEQAVVGAGAARVGREGERAARFGEQPPRRRVAAAVGVAEGPLRPRRARIAASRSFERAISSRCAFSSSSARRRCS